ncbi:unnamed protein product [Eruca vesicaria subsp. sativa]|uniref:Uncharacterized protein n=1 Tax=Eruca vesicaria subsp. sativa TaxID=29727 RepID=A0ABC8K138_ERUVS|nr:unnamed protein product [Eruca vesicaria subsp. sativa]
MDVDVDSAKTNSSSEDSKSEKEKGKRKLYVGSQALNYCRDHMEILSPIKDGIVSDCVSMWASYIIISGL